MRTYPNFSANSTGFPPGPSASSSPLGTYPDEMQTMTLNQDYKNMGFAPLSGFFPTPDMIGNMAKNTPTQQSQPQQPQPQQPNQPQSQQTQQSQQNPTTSKGQQYNQTGSSSNSELNTAFKTAQQQQPDYNKTYQPGSNSSYYNVPQQYSQASNYPYGQPQQMNFSRQSYLPSDNKY